VQPLVDHIAHAPDRPPDAPLAMQVFADLSRQLAAMNGKLDDVTGRLDDVTGKLDDATDELEMLRRVIEPRLLNRKEAARLAGCSTRTIQRHEDRGHIQRAPTKGGGAFYAYADVAKLKRMMK